MSKLKPIGVIGAAIHPVVNDGNRRCLEEIIYDTVQECLRDAGVTTADYEGIVCGSNDQYDGRAISVMAASGSVGGVDRDILSTPSSAEHAFVMGALRVASGQFETQLIVAWGPLEATSQSDVERLAADPYYHRALPQDDLAGQALQASAILAKTPSAQQLALDIVTKNRTNGTKAYPETAAKLQSHDSMLKSRVRRWPLREDMVSPPTVGVVAMFLASKQFMVSRGITNAAWITGMGWATEPSFLGDRDLSKAPALAAAKNAAYDQAGIADPAVEIDLAEVADVSPYQQLIACDVLGLTDAVPVNLSGGAQSRNPMFCGGLVAIGEVVNQVRNRSGNHQKSGVKRGLAHAASGIAMQYQTVIILETSEGAPR